MPWWRCLEDAVFVNVLVETAGDEALYKNSGKNVALLFVPTSVSKKGALRDHSKVGTLVLARRAYDSTNSIQI